MSKDNQFETAMAKVASVISAARGAREGGHLLSPGDLSDLRRMDVVRPSGAFWRLMITFVPEAERSGDEKERRWAVVCRAMAVMAPRVHDASVRPGAALSWIGFSSEDRPIRINRLLSAEGDSFENLLLSACRFLAAKSQPVDWQSFGRLVLHQDDAARKTLARDFYTAKARRAVV